jgi:anti-sigma B factor antagonist
MSYAVFELHKSEGDSAAIPAHVTVTGEVDVTNVEEFTQSVLDVAGKRPIVLELSPVKYFDSAGFAALDRLLEQGVIVLVLAPDSFLYRVADLMCFPIHHDVETARRVLQENAS